jgi:cell division protease FtsH
MAKKASPSIIFVDEIDAIGRMRGTGLGGGNDEREQTLNQILVEMDGFSQTEKVIVMAATNRPDVLDPALVRPGRFDRRVTLDLPDKKDREEILQVQARKKPLDGTVDLHQVAQRTPGFSGADLYSLMNESAILAARENKKSISQLDIVNSIEKVILGPERKSHLMSSKEKELTAYHEAGHALVGSVLPNADPVHKVSIISRGSAGGYTLSLPTDDRKLHSRKSFLDEIAMTLGGYAAEEFVFGDITTGPSSDLQSATLKARDMVVRYGMSDKVGPRALEIQMNKKRSFDDVNKDHSESLSRMVDEEIERIVREGLETARKVVREYKNVLDAITKRLIEVENIERDEFEGILRTYKIPVKVDER